MGIALSHPIQIGIFHEINHPFLKTLIYLVAIDLGGAKGPGTQGLALRNTQWRARDSAHCLKINGQLT